MPKTMEQGVSIPADRAILLGDLAVPESPGGMVLFAHGSGSSRHSPRNRFVAGQLQDAGLGTLLMDLLTRDEERADAARGHLRFDIVFLAERLLKATDWLLGNAATAGLPLGYFGASTGAAAALVAAGKKPEAVSAIVSRGGRPDLAAPSLRLVKAPTLLIVGGDDFPVITMNEKALERLQVEKRLVIVPGATHLFEEPGTLEEVARLAAGWFSLHLGRALQSRLSA